MFAEHQREAKRNEVITMPMLRVRCRPPGIGPFNGWPEYVQCLPPIGSLMDNSTKPIRAYVDGYTFYADGIIELHLTEKNPLQLR